MKTRNFTLLEQSNFVIIDTIKEESIEEMILQEHKGFSSSFLQLDFIKELFNEFGISIDYRSCMGFSAILIQSTIDQELVEKHISYIYHFCYDNFYTEIDWELFKTQIYPNKIPVFD